MTKKITYLLIPAAMICSAAMAQPAPSNQVLLSSEQMDQVTAGASASVSADATASGTIAVTDIKAFTNVTSQNGGTVAVAGGIAGGAAAGANATTSAKLDPATSPGSYTKEVGVTYSSPTLSFQGAIQGTFILK